MKKEKSRVLLEVLLEGVDVPHVVRGQAVVSVGTVFVLALHSVVRQVYRLVKVDQAELLRAKPQVAFSVKVIKSKGANSGIRPSSPAPFALLLQVQVQYLTKHRLRAVSE